MFDEGVLGKECLEGVCGDKVVFFAVCLSWTGLPRGVWRPVSSLLSAVGQRTRYAETKLVWMVAKETGDEGALSDAGRAKHHQGTGQRHGVTGMSQPA